MFRRALWTLAALGWAALAQAQGAGRMTVFDYGASQGLPEGQVASILQDRQGRYWVAADHGVYVGDGSFFQKIPFGAPEERPRFQALAEDGLGRIYLLGEAGLFLLEENRWRRVDGDLPAPAGSLGLYRDGAGVLWMLRSGRLYRVEAPGRYAEAPLAAPQATVLSARPKGPGLLAREGGRTWRMERGHWQALPDIPLRTGEEFRSALQEDARGVLWTSTYHRIFRLEDGAKAWIPVSDTAGNGGFPGGVWSLRGGEVWVSGDRSAYRLDEAETPLESTPTFSVYSMRILLRDREGWLWTDRNGLHRLGGPWRIHSGENGLPAAGIWQALRDAEGRMWLSSTEGLFHFDGQRWVRMWKTRIHSQIALGGDGCIWAAEFVTGRFLRFRPHQPPERTEPLPPELQGLQAMRGLSGANGRLALSTRDGRIFFGTWEGRWTWESRPSPVQKGSLRTFSDALGHLHLVGTSSAGRILHALDGGPWLPLPMAAGLGPTDVQLWPDGRLAAVQYEPPSLQLFRRGAEGWNLVSQIDLEESSPCTVAYGLGRLTDGRCWILTDHGVLELNPDHPGRARHFTTQEGLPLDDCNQFGLLMERDRTWVSTGTGLAAYDRRDETQRPEMAGPILLGARLDEGPWSLVPETPLPSGLRALTLQIGVPSPALKPHLRFQWRDLEHNGAWQLFDGPTLPFLNPAPGRHRLEVRCLEPGGHPSPTWSFTFQVRLPWWRRPWALLLWTLGAGGLALFAHRARLRRIQRRNMELAALVAERTAALVASEERERGASKAKSAFLADMSHELRTPLNAILLYSELIHQSAEDGGAEELAKDSSRILSASRHLLSLINGILDLSKIEAGKVSVGLEQVHLSTLLEEAAITLGPLAREREDTLSIEVDPPDLEWRTDPLKLRQVLINLAGNAIKFTSAGRVTLRARMEEGILHLEVQDTGVGMSPEQSARVFHAYEQPTQEGGYKAGGTGLGLTISRNYIELLGGTIEVDSVKGVGTTFRIRLPRPAEEPSTAHPSP